MKQLLRLIGVAAVGFALGLGAAHMPLARAAAAPLQAAAIDLLAISPDAMPTPTATFPNLRSKTVVVTDGMVAALQMGTALKHYHADANEIQIVLAGTGTERLGQQSSSAATRHDDRDSDGHEPRGTRRHVGREIAVRIDQDAAAGAD